MNIQTYQQEVSKAMYMLDTDDISDDYIEWMYSHYRKYKPAKKAFKAALGDYRTIVRLHNENDYEI